MAVYESDVLIIGTGIAGLSACIKLAEAGHRVALMTRERDPHISNTYWAQGGIVYPSPNDKSFEEDIERAGSEVSYTPAIHQIAKRGGEIIDEILIQKARTNFERDIEGGLKFTKEAAHSKQRILYRGDYTGKEIQTSLLNYLKDFPNVEILAQHTAIDLLTPLHHGINQSQRYEDNQVVGAYALDQTTGEVVRVMARKTILATGGIGGIYLHHSNSEGARGDGHAMARRAGAALIDLEYIQFHPTTFYDSSSDRRFLISEAVRGEGGILLNSEGQAFMQNYHPDRELAPRDVVARAIVEETIKTQYECVFLDISRKDPDWIKERFPTIYKHCLEKSIDISRDPIPVVPAAHYTCGGVKVDLQGKTSLTNLYAVGEVACTGLHGANRLASTSLLEGLTWGYCAAEDILKELNESTHYPVHSIRSWELGTGECDDALLHQDWMTLKQTMWNYVGLIRTEQRIHRAHAMFRELHDEIQKFYKDAQLKDRLIGLRNAVETGYMVLMASQRNKKSLGCFYRQN